MQTLILITIIGGLIGIILAMLMRKKYPKGAYAALIAAPVLAAAGGFIALDPALTPRATPLPQRSAQDAPPPMATTPKAMAKEEAQLREALAENPANSYAILQLGGLYIAQERYHDAIVLLTKAHDQHPDDRDIALQLSTAYFTRGLRAAEYGEYDKAARSLKLAQTITPDDSPFKDDIPIFLQKIEMKQQQEQTPQTKATPP